MKRTAHERDYLDGGEVDGHSGNGNGNGNGNGYSSSDSGGDAGDSFSKRARLENSVPASLPSPSLSSSASSSVSLSPANFFKLPPQNPLFRGREADLHALYYAALSAAASPRSKPIALVGASGVGKSQIALAFAHRHKDSIKRVWWIGAETVDGVYQGFRRLAAELEVLDSNLMSNDQLVGVVHCALANQPCESGSSAAYMLVFDNAEPTRELMDVLPHGDAGLVLLTSRSKRWDGIARVLEIGKLSEGDAVSVLLTRAGLEDAGSAAAAKALARRLDCLPLALTMAGSLVRETGLAMEKYAAYMDRSAGDLQSELNADAGHPLSVYAAWKKSTEAAARRCPDAMEVLRFASVCGADGIPVAAVEAFLEARPPSPTLSFARLWRLVGVASEPSPSTRAEEAVAILQQFALVHLDGADSHQAGSSTLSVHRLVQEMTRDSLGAEEETRLISTVCTVLGALADEADDSPEDMHRRAAMVGPIESLIALHHSHLSLEALAALHQTLGRVLYRCASEPMQAKTRLEQALALRQIVERDPHRDVHSASILSDLGRACSMLDECGQAKAHFERALAIHEAQSSVNPDELANLHVHVAITCMLLSEFPDSVAHLNRALVLREGHLEPNHPRVAATHQLFSLVHCTQGDFAAARRHEEMALAMHEANFGPDSAQVTAVLAKAGEICRKMRDFDSAKQYQLRALAIHEAHFGGSHAQVGHALSQLGITHLDMAEYSAAKKCLSRALKIYNVSDLPEEEHERIQATKLALQLAEQKMPAYTCVVL